MNPKQDEGLAAEAVDWLVRLNSGMATDADRTAFLHWRGQTPDHDQAAREIEALWRDVGRTPVAHAHRIQPVGPRRGAVTRRFVLAGTGLAAAAACGLVVETGALNRLFSDFATGVGERRDVDLPDGSLAHLNTESALSLAYTGAERRLSLAAGESVFEVVHEGRPFIVDAGGGNVTATGTVFGVRCGSDRTEVTCAEGTILVSLKAGDAQRLQPGEGTSYDGQRFLSPVESVDLATLTAWRRGKLIFNNRPLNQVVAEIERYQVGRIVVIGEGLQAMPVSGVFDLDDVPGIMRTIASTLPVSVTELPLLTIVRPS
jgi:transmembrane sensor